MLCIGLGLSVNILYAFVITVLRRVFDQQRRKLTGIGMASLPLLPLPFLLFPLILSPLSLLLFPPLTHFLSLPPFLSPVLPFPAPSPLFQLDGLALKSDIWWQQFLRFS